MNENEIKELKEQLKKELLAEMNIGKRKDSAWDMVRKEYEEEIKRLNKIPSDNHSLEDAIRTLIRAKYGVRNVVNVEADYQELKDIVEKILNILKEKV